MAEEHTYGTPGIPVASRFLHSLPAQVSAHPRQPSPSEPQRLEPTEALFLLLFMLTRSARSAAAAVEEVLLLLQRRSGGGDGRGLPFGSWHPIIIVFASGRREERRRRVLLY